MLLRNIIFAIVVIFACNANAAISCRENALGGQNCTDRTTGDVWRGRRDVIGNMKYTSNTSKTIKSRATANGTTVYTDKSGARTTCRKNAMGATVCRSASGDKITCHTNAVGYTVCK